MLMSNQHSRIMVAELPLECTTTAKTFAATKAIRTQAQKGVLRNNNMLAADAL